MAILLYIKPKYLMLINISEIENIDFQNWLHIASSLKPKAYITLCLYCFRKCMFRHSGFLPICFSPWQGHCKLIFALNWILWWMHVQSIFNTYIKIYRIFSHFTSWVKTGVYLYSRYRVFLWCLNTWQPSDKFFFVSSTMLHSR